MNRRFGEAIKAGVKYRPRPGAYGILRLCRQMLITHQSQPDEEYQLPVGGIDAGESPLAALHREVFEETGWGMSVERRMGAFLRYTYMPEYDFWARKICHIYLCRPTRQKGDIPEPFHTAHWIDISEARHILSNQGDRHFVGLL
jgi:8-oxo-dGTP diphosphatase